VERDLSQSGSASVVVKAKIQRTRPRPGSSRPRPGPFKAETWILETKTKSRTLEFKGNFKAKYDSQFNVNIPHAIDMTIAPIS